jgi:Ni,Fe-hydrogenase maturation factor
VSQKSGVEDSLDSSIRLLTPELIPEPFDGILETVVIRGETAGNSTHEATSDYNNDIIVVDIREVSNETGDLRLYEYIRPT